MDSRTEWLALAAGTLIPLAQAGAFLAFALDPERFLDGTPEVLVVLTVGELGFNVLGIAAGVLLPLVPAGKRAPAYAAVTLALAIAAFFAVHTQHVWWAWFAALAALGHVARSFLFGADDELRKHRAEAMVNDSINLVVLMLWSIVLAAALGFAADQLAGDVLDTQWGGRPDWHHLAAVPAAFIAMRALSVLVATGDAFTVHERGYFDGPRLNKFISYLGRGKRSRRR